MPDMRRYARLLAALATGGGAAIVLLVPVLAATRCSMANGERNPKLFCRASLSHKISVMIAVASGDAMRVSG